MRPELERRLAVLVEPLDRAVLDGVREFEGDPDRIRVELGLVPVFADERPLIGLAGFIDWRSSGRLSAVLRSGFFRGAAGEQLLMPGERRWPVDRLVLVGLGPRAEFNERRARELGSRCVAIAAGLSADSVLIALPGKSIVRSLVEIAFDSVLEAIERSAAEQAHELAGGEVVGVSEPLIEAHIEAKIEAASEPKIESSEAAEPGAHGEIRVVPTAGEDAISSDTAGTQPVEPSTETAAAVAEEALVEAPVDQPALESPQQDEPLAAIRRPEPRWWVVVDESLVARLRRVRSGPPKAARGGPSLHT